MQIIYFFWAGGEGATSFEISVINTLKKVICDQLRGIEKFQVCRFKYWAKKQRQGCTYLDQQMYNDELKEVDISREKDV